MHLSFIKIITIITIIIITVVADNVDSLKYFDSLIHRFICYRIKSRIFGIHFEWKEVGEGGMGVA